MSLGFSERMVAAATEVVRLDGVSREQNEESPAAMGSRSFSEALFPQRSEGKCAEETLILKF